MGSTFISLPSKISMEILEFQIRGLCSSPKISIKGLSLIEEDDMTTTYFLNLTAGNLFGSKKDPSIPAAYYIGLSSTAPDVSGTNVTEPSTSGTGYARV